MVSQTALNHYALTTLTTYNIKLNVFSTENQTLEIGCDIFNKNSFSSFNIIFEAPYLH